MATDTETKASGNAKGAQQTLEFVKSEDIVNCEHAIMGHYLYLRVDLDAKGTPSSTGKSTTIAKSGFPKVIDKYKNQGVMVGLNVGIKP